MATLRMTGQRLAITALIASVVVPTTSAQEGEGPCIECGEPPEAPIHQPPRPDHPFHGCACRIAILEASAKTPGSDDPEDRVDIRVDVKERLESPDTANRLQEELTVRNLWDFRVPGVSTVQSQSIELTVEEQISEIGGPFCPPIQTRYQRDIRFGRLMDDIKREIGALRNVAPENIEGVSRQPSTRFTIDVKSTLYCEKGQSATHATLVLRGEPSEAFFARSSK